MSSQADIVLFASTKLESLLASLGAHGRGLNTMCSSLEHLLPADIVWSVRFVARIRNRLVHEHEVKISDIGTFQYQASSAIDYLEKLLVSIEEAEEPVRTGITVTIPDKIFHRVPIEELEWCSAQDLSFPLEKSKS